MVTKQLKVEVLLIAMLCVLGGASGFAAEKTKTDERKVPYLVWPLPPDQPRVRFMGEIRSNLDIEPRQKRSVFQKLIGAADPNVELRFRKPTGLTTDSRGRLFVADSGRALVFVVDWDNRKVSYLGAGEGMSPKTPVDVTTDGQDRVFVADAGLKSVLVYGSDLTLENVISEPEELLNPAGVAVDRERGRLYVVDSKGHHVVVFDLATLRRIDTFGERGEGLGKLNFPVGIAVDAEGFIYVTDTGSCTVQVFDADFQPVRSFGDQGIAPGQFTRPKQIALDSEGHVYVVDAAFNNFQIFSREDLLLMFVGSHGQDYGRFDLPFGIHIDSRDRIYVSDQLNGRVQIFQFLGGDRGAPPAGAR